jgi:small subunit ribosomal protein S6
MQNYMLTVLVKDSLDEKGRVALLDSIKKQFDSVQKEDLWGMRSLAYPIQHKDKAFYAHFEFAAEQNKISALDNSLKLNEDVIRSLLTVKEEKKVRKIRGHKAQVISNEKVEEKSVEASVAEPVEAAVEDKE